MNNVQKAFKRKATRGLADGGQPSPHMLGTGMAANAGIALARRPQQLEAAIGAATGATPSVPSGYAGGGGGGGLSARRDNAVPPAHMLVAQRRGLADGGEPKRKPHGGAIEGPGGPTDDMAGEFKLSAKEYVLPADTVDALGGPEVLDEVRDATHEFVDEENRPRGLANGGMAGPAEPSWFQKQRAAAATERRAADEVKAGTANSDMQALYEKNQAAVRTPEVMNPLGEVPGIGLASRGGSAVASTGVAQRAFGGLRDGANKVTNFFANKAAAPAVASAAPKTGKVLPGTVSNGFTNAERVAATPPGYATGGLAQSGASAASKLSSGQMPTAGRIGANALATNTLGSDGAVPATAEGMVTSAPSVSTSAPGTVPAPAEQVPEFGKDRGTGFILNHQTGKRTNIDSRDSLGLGPGLAGGRGVEADSRSDMTRSLSERAQQYNSDADALMAKQGGGIGEALVARGLRNGAKDTTAQAMTSQGLDDARETQQIGLQKARLSADLAAQREGNAQYNADRTYGLSKRAADRADGKDRRDNTATMLEGKLGKQFDKDGNLNPAYAEFSSAIANTLQGRTNPDGTPMTIETLPSQELEQMTQTLGLSQKGELKNWRKALNWLMGDSKPSSNEIEGGLRPNKTSAEKSWLGGYTWKDQDGREYFSDDLSYDEQIALGIRPERNQ